MATFVQDVEEIRKRAMRKIEEGAVTESYELDQEQAIAVLNEALATEIVCVLRYMHHYFMATGVHGKAVAEEFKEHADQEREHADEIGERIAQLGGKPDFNPGTLLQRSIAQYVEGENLADMIKEDLIAERMVIEVYQRMIEFFGMKDPVTRALLEHIKAEEEEHANDLSDLLYITNPQTGADEGQDPGTDPLRLSQRAPEVSREDQQRRPDVAGSFSDRQRSPERSSTHGWGNESNVGTRGKGGAPQSTTAPGTSWGNEQNVGKRNPQSRPAESGSGQDHRSDRQERERNALVEEATAGMNRPNRSGNQKSENTNVTNRPQDEHVDPGTERGNDRGNKSRKLAEQGTGNLANARGKSAADRDTRREAQQSSTGEMRPTRERGASKQFNEQGIGLSGESEPPASNIGGVGGRRMNRRTAGSQEEVDFSEVAENTNAGAHTGTNRTPKILEKNRKKKRAA